MSASLRIRFRTLTALLTAAAIALTAVAESAAAPTTSGAARIERIAVNDNRRAAGTLADGKLTVHLEVRTGEWYPETDADGGVIVKSFALEGGPLQIPGPLLRVVEGTEIRVWVKNRLDGEPLVLHGLYSRPVRADAAPSVTIPAGEVREIRFVAGTPGTYFYWGASSGDVARTQRPARDTQLSGAFIVDPAGAPPPQDRVLVITGWREVRTIGTEEVGVVRLVINGKSWPHTERLTYDIGEKVRMRILNLSATVHPMHLHGFYFDVKSRGDEHVDTVYPTGSSPRLVNTERLVPGRTFSLTWIPTRSGNWLFHCHDSVHIVRTRLLDGRPVPAPANHHTVNHALEMMSGPVMGITVRPNKSAIAVPDAVARRRLRLIARVDAGGSQLEPAYGFVLEGDGKSIPSGPPYLPGPTIVLTQGESVSITVENRLPEPTAVHWHGIELESYFDGVAGFAGSPGRIAPAIAPGGSFEARFTPPRAGTFIYHAHVDEVRQLQAGLSGALLVLDSPASHDPERDIVLLVTAPRKIADDNVVLLNGTATPAPRQMKVGERYRLRFINIHTSRPSMRMRMVRNNELVTWRALAKDGMDAPADQAVVGPSEVQMGNGETYDFEFVPTAPGANRIEIRANAGSLLASMTIQIQ